MVRRLAALCALAAALALAAPAAAQLPVGEADGVRLTRDRAGSLVVVFPKKAYRRIAGKRVYVECTTMADSEGIVEGGGTKFRAPRGGRRLRTGDLTRGFDYCRVWRERFVVRRGRRTRVHSRRLIVSIPATQRGAVFLDEERRTWAMLGLLGLAEAIMQGRDLPGMPTPAQLLAETDRLRRFPIVALAGAGDVPPPGALGYYSDGARHFAAVVVSASGRRLFVEWDGDTLHTNVVGHIFDAFD